MRSRTILLALLLMAASCALPAAAHAAVPFFGPIIPSGVSLIGDSQTCMLGWGAVIMIINNIISFFLTLAILFVAPVMIAYAGFLMVVNPTSAGDVTKARTIIWNTVKGILIALAAWLIVDAFMAVLYNAGAPDQEGGILRTWQSLIVSSGGIDPCLPQAGATTVNTPGAAPPRLTTTPQPTTTGGTGNVTVNSLTPSGASVQVALTTTQSDASLLRGYAAAENYSAQINQACQGSSVPNCSTVITAIIAQESGGDPSSRSPAGALGIMQLTSANGGRTCASTDTACVTDQINKGVQLFERGYTRFPSVSNALAAYNSGMATQAGQSPSGRNSAMVDSIHCPGQYAWQCPIQPGGLAETRGYVANICQNLYFQEVTCN